MRHSFYWSAGCMCKLPGLLRCQSPTRPSRNTVRYFYCVRVRTRAHGAAPRPDTRPSCIMVETACLEKATPVAGCLSEAQDCIETENSFHASLPTVGQRRLQGGGLRYLLFVQGTLAAPGKYTRWRCACLCPFPTHTHRVRVAVPLNARCALVTHPSAAEDN